MRIRDESRTNTAVIDPTTGEQTEVNERGPAITEQELELFRDKLLYLAQGAEICVFAGSLPHGVPADVYGGLIRELRKLGVVTTSSTPRASRCATPSAVSRSVVSPNVLEAEELVGHEFNDDDDQVVAVREMVSLGAREAIITVQDGCFAHVLEDGGRAIYRVRLDPSLVEPRTTIGSGDAFLAGYVATRYGGASAAECLRYGVACGAESTEHFGAGVIEPARVERLLAEVEITRLELPAEISR